MADIKISALPVASTVSDADIVVINQSGTTKTATRALVRGTIPSGTVTSVIGGTGLSGGTITSSGTLAVQYGTTANTSAQGNDSRLSDSRTPTAHKSTHATGGSDALSAGDIGAAASSTTITAGTGLSGGGDLTANRTLSVSYGNTAGTAAQGNDSRLSDSRTPTTHALTHAAGGSDAITVNVASQVTGVLGTANGGTGVTTSVGSNSVVLRDSNANIVANAFIGTLSTITASASQVVLLRSSSVENLVIGSGGQTIKLPDATTLTPGSTFGFNNNQSSGAILVNNNSNTLVVSVPSGGYSVVSLLDNATAAGTWERHEQAPSNVSWSTNTFDYTGSITSATWNGNAVAVNRGGTGAATQQAAINTLAGATTSAQFLRGNGTNVVMSAIQASDVPTLNQNTTGTAANVTGTVAIGNGGTGATTQQAALNAISGTQTAGYHFRSDGTNVSLQPLNVSDVTAGTLAIANGGTGASTAQSAISNFGVGMRMVEAQFTAGLVGTMNTGVSPNTFTVTAVGAQNPDGYTVSVGDIVAFPLQGGGTSTQNGFWQVTTLGDGVTQAVFTRPSWFSGTVKNTMYMTRFGTTQAGYVMSVVGPVGNTEIIVGTGSISVYRVSYRSANAITGVNAFTGIQTFQANGTAVNKCPFSFASGVALMSATQPHAVEWFNDQMYLTNAAGVRTTNTNHVAIPATATSTGQVGQISVDNTGSWLYVCTATNVWKRVLLTTF
jgi:hypothetical protein